MNHAVSAAGKATVVPAVVVVSFVAIIAFLALAHARIPATSHFTGIRTVVVVDAVPIIALFDTNVDDRISTGRFLAGVGAGIVVTHVAVVAFLTLLDDAIETAG